MSYVAPVSAVLLMMWTARAATSAGPTTRPVGNVARSSLRRSSSRSPSSDADKRGVDEACSDEVHANRREFEREGRRERWQRSGRRDDPETVTDAPAAGAAHEDQRAAGPHLAYGVARDLKPQHHMPAERFS